MNESRYRDLDLNFIKHPVTLDLSTKTDGEAIKRSLRNLVLTNIYEKPFHPEISSDVRDLLFEPATPLTAIRLKKAITEVIENFEPRIDLLEVSIWDDIDNNAFNVTIIFRVQNVDRSDTITFELERLR